MKGVLVMAVKDIGYSSLEALVNYSGTNYSPNNIRRIIISPEGVGVFYFVGKKAELKEFPLLTYMQYLKGTSPKDFKPMLSVLYSGKQLTSVEEIIILPMGSNGASVLHPDEYSIRTIVGNRGASSYEGCKNSYKRLRYISIIQNVTFKQFLGAIRGNKEDFISLAGT
jgi:hypothetical protein